jgi:hypothetical protein
MLLLPMMAPSHRPKPSTHIARFTRVMAFSGSPFMKPARVMMPVSVPKESNISTNRNVHTASQKMGVRAYLKVSLPEGMTFMFGRKK